MILFVFRYSDGQFGVVPAVRYLNLLFTNNESTGLFVWIEEGLPKQHGFLHRLGTGHLLL